jgi:hypothetical protein
VRHKLLLRHPGGKRAGCQVALDDLFSVPLLVKNRNCEIRTHQFALSAAAAIILSDCCGKVISPFIDSNRSGKHFSRAKITANFTPFAQLFVYFNHLMHHILPKQMSLAGNMLLPGDIIMEICRKFKYLIFFHLK